jgi:hypothetical protein
MIMSRRMTWAGHIACIQEISHAYKMGHRVDCLRIGSRAVSCGHGNKSLGSIRGRTFLD